MIKTFFARYVPVIAAVVLAAGCTSLPAGGTAPSPTAAAATQGPAATVAPGSTEAAGTGGIPTAGLTAAAGQTPSAAPVEATAAPTPGGPPTTAPEPTMPPAPTAPPETAATAAAAGAVSGDVQCTPGQLTPSQTEGPYYKANPPEASNLLQPGMGGTKLIVTGYVLNASCQPVPGARVDFWQADSEGQYDNQGYTLRGWELADGQGRYSVETVVPGLYPGRTRHIHVKVNAPNGPVLTTQLYFPDEPANQSDGIFSPDLVMKVEKTADGEAGTFNFVINDK